MTTNARKRGADHAPDDPVNPKKRKTSDAPTLLKRPKKRKASPKNKAQPYKSNAFPNFGLPLDQETYQGCTCKGPCISITCPCIQDGTPCLGYCRCDPKLCTHPAPACNCKECGPKCPCRLSHRPCTEACERGSRSRKTFTVCNLQTCNNVHIGRRLPDFKIKNSTVPGAGKGYFAMENIAKGQLIANLDGNVEQDFSDERVDGAMDMFELSKGHYLRLDHTKAYFVNEKPRRTANALFSYSVGEQRKEILLHAKRNIKQGQEIFAPYGLEQTFPGKNDKPLVDDYVLVKGCGPTKIEHWLGKVVRVNSDVQWRVKWLIRKQDLHWLPENVRASVKLEPGEHIMTDGWEQDVEAVDLVRPVACQESKPEQWRICKNKWWWTKTYNCQRKRLV